MLQQVDIKHNQTAGHTNVVWSIAMNKDGTQAVSVSHDETIRYWDTMNGTLTRTIKGTPGSGTHHTSTIYMIVVGA
jgi:WD40 repeat protein